MGTQDVMRGVRPDKATKYVGGIGSDGEARTVAEWYALAGYDQYGSPMDETGKTRASGSAHCAYGDGCEGMAIADRPGHNTRARFVTRADGTTVAVEIATAPAPASIAPIEQTPAHREHKAVNLPWREQESSDAVSAVTSTMPDGTTRLLQPSRRRGQAGARKATGPSRAAQRAAAIAANVESDAQRLDRLTRILAQGVTAAERESVRDR